MNTPYNRFDEAREILSCFQHVVPHDTLKRFVDAITMSDQPPLSQDGRRDERIVIYGRAFWNENLIFMPLSRALDQARITIAKRTARTWGEFINALDTETAVWAIQLERSWSERPDFLTYYSEYLKDHPHGTWADAWMIYAEGEEYSRPCFDSDEFDFIDWDQMLTDACCDSNPEVDMYGSAPGTIIKQFATIKNGVFDGPYVGLKAVDEREIVACYEELGYIPIRDDMLIDVACGEMDDSAMAMRRILHYSEVDEALAVLDDKYCGDT